MQLKAKDAVGIETAFQAAIGRKDLC